MLSVLIVSHGHEEDIKKLLASIIGFMKVDFEIILIDNLNSGNFRTVFSELCLTDKAILVENIYPKSFAINNNIAFGIARYETILFLNPDTTFIDTTLSDFIPHVKNLSKGIYFPRLLNPDRTIQNSGKKKPNFFDQILTFAGIFFNKKRESPPGDYWYFGAAILTTKQWFNKLGGFDESFPMYAEDTELCVRARKYGYEVKLLEEINIIHNLGGDSKGRYKWRAVYSNILLRYKMMKLNRKNK